MAAFTSPDDLRRYVGGIFETALQDADLGPKLSGTGLTLRVVTTEPEAILVIDLPNKKIELDDFTSADATMTMSSETANAFWQGKVNLPVAMARGRVKVDGRMAALLKLVPSTPKLFPKYRALLVEDGRTDLLED